MACGLPIICADKGGPADIVVNMETGIKVQPNNLNDSVKAIKYLIDNPQIAEKMGKNGRIRAKSVYSMKGVAQQHLELFESCLKSKRNRYKS
jgi:glycosyltransferase involved in cell wall biosynthesis